MFKKFEKSESPLSAKGLSLLPSYTIPGFIYESAISMLISSKITRFFTILTNNFLGEDLIPPTQPRPVTSLSHLPKLKSIISNAFLPGENTAGCHIHIHVQWRSSAPKSGGTNFFSQKVKSKKKKKGHSGVKAQDRVLLIGEGL